MDYFATSGAHVLVDGQFGSTGKGVLAAYLAEKAAERNIRFHGVISNAGPNSGHTFYVDDEKHVLKQLPTFAVASALIGVRIPIYLSAGAIIDPEILRKEAAKYHDCAIMVHPNAAVIHNWNKDEEQGGSIAAVAGTRSGTGSALAAKIHREPNGVWDEVGHVVHEMPHNVVTMRTDFRLIDRQRYFVEVSQGFSLGINSQFYPKVTSRECTVMQAIADARIAPRFVQRTFMVARTFPIRVGNVDGHSSGSWYPDQVELEWADIGVQPELTTVTQRERRIATFSVQQMTEAVIANQPDFVLLNFMNYLKDGNEVAKMHHMIQQVKYNSGVDFHVLTGHGPKSSQVVPF